MQSKKQKRGTERYSKLAVHEWQDGITVEYREYSHAYSVWLKQGKVGIMFERQGLRSVHCMEDCFERAFQLLETKNPFDMERLKYEARALTPGISAELENLMDLNQKFDKL